MAPDERGPSWPPTELTAGAADEGRRLDVALVPSIEYFCNPGATVVSDACIACRGPVQSVKLYGRVPVEKIRSWEADFHEFMDARQAALLREIRTGRVLSDALAEQLKAAIAEYQELEQ